MKPRRVEMDIALFRGQRGLPQRPSETGPGLTGLSQRPSCVQCATPWTDLAIEEPMGASIWTPCSHSPKRERAGAGSRNGTGGTVVRHREYHHFLHLISRMQPPSSPNPSNLDLHVFQILRHRSSITTPPTPSAPHPADSRARDRASCPAAPSGGTGLHKPLTACQSRVGSRVGRCVARNTRRPTPRLRRAGDMPGTRPVAHPAERTQGRGVVT